MEVELRVFGLVAKSLGFQQKKIQLERSTTIHELLRMLELKISNRWLVISVNGIKRTGNYQLNDQDVITIHPICGGG